MSEALKYKQQARDFEQREDWERAIEAYELALKAVKRRGDSVDLALYNRIGDLYRRIGDVGKAVQFYEAAADAHMEAGFYNNAIALCNKILRCMPNRHSIYLKLGKIGAGKGFLVDARKHFLEYAERMQRSGQLDEAFSALMEFADISPDPEIRLMIADQLLEHDREGQAVEQLRLAWRDLRNDGREADAEEVRKRIVGMAPDRDPEVDPPEAEAMSSTLDAEGVIDLPEIDPYSPSPAEEQEREPEAGAEVEPLEIVPTALTESEEPAEEPTEVEPLEIVPTSLTDESEPAVEEPTTEAPPAEEETGDDWIEGFDDLGGDEEAAVAMDEPAIDEPSDADVDELEAALLEAADEPDDADVDELEAALLEAADETSMEVEEPPTEEIELIELPQVEEPEVLPEERVVELRARLETEGREPDTLVELAEALLEVGDRDEATAHLREALDGYDSREQLHEARRVLDELLLLDRNDVHAYQKHVEFALRSGERGALVEAYLDLADCLDRTDAGNKARIVYSRVLELDPENARARSALELFGEEEEGEEAATVEAGAGGDYVDLSSLVQEERESKSTRFTVPAAEPQSEEEVNFSEMLSQFKSKVAETIEEEDVASHYDLGVAFKEMGLLDEAIAEFQIASRSTEFRLKAIEMLGHCFLEKEDYRIALKVLNRALQIPSYTDDDLVAVFYAMGRAHEALGESDQALESYERVLGCDIHFADAAKRVSVLRG